MTAKVSVVQVVMGSFGGNTAKVVDNQVTVRALSSEVVFFKAVNYCYKYRDLAMSRAIVEHMNWTDLAQLSGSQTKILFSTNARGYDQ